MPWVGDTPTRTDGTRTGPTVWDQAAVAVETILSNDHDTHDQDIAGMIGLCLHRGGANAVTANISWGNFKITNLAEATANGEAVNKGQMDTADTATLSSANTYTDNAVSGLASLTAINRWTQQQQWNVGSTITSAATLAIPDDGNAFKVEGAVTVTAFSTKPVGTWIWLEFDEALTLTHGPNLLLNNNGDNIAVEAGDRSVCIQGTATAWTVWVMRASGEAVRATTPAISKEFTSAEQTITAGGTVTLAHGLGVDPKIMQCYLICKTAENGWSVGDKMMLDWIHIYGGTAQSRGHTLYFDATNVYILWGNSAPGNTYEGMNKTTGARIAPTDANWRLVVKAYA